MGIVSASRGSRNAAPLTGGFETTRSVATAVSAHSAFEPTSVPLIDVQRQYRTLEAEIQAALSEVLDSGWFILGRQVAAFEEEFAAYTGVAYICTVAILIAPYLLLSNVYRAGGIMLTSSVLIILAYNFYITTAKGRKLWRRFFEMAGISLCVALISFGVGVLVRTFYRVDI